jgi:hypothetical protein
MRRRGFSLRLRICVRRTKQADGLEGDQEIVCGADFDAAPSLA